MIKRKYLFLVLAEPYYSLVESGKKREEYRDITPYYNSRFINKEYEYVVFINGYHTKAKRMCWSIKSIDYGLGKTRYQGDPYTPFWVIKLGEKAPLPKG
jgi:hypothetical protein